jgi:hypothetical protein
LGRSTSLERHVITVDRLRELGIGRKELDHLVGFLPYELGTKGIRTAKRSLSRSATVSLLSKRAMYALTLAGKSVSDGTESCSLEIRVNWRLVAQVLVVGSRSFPSGASDTVVGESAVARRAPRPAPAGAAVAGGRGARTDSHPATEAAAALASAVPSELCADSQSAYSGH